MTRVELTAADLPAMLADPALERKTGAAVLGGGEPGTY
jgi:hypothetical protein